MLSHGVNHTNLRLRRSPVRNCCQIKNDNNHKVWGLCYPTTSFAFTQVLFQAFYNKQTVVNCYSEEYSTVIKLLEKHKITNLTCTPTYINMLIISLKNKITNIKNGIRKC